MRLKTFVGASMAEALDRVQKELGADALVLETRTRGEATEVVAAEVEREEPAEGVMKLRAEVALLRRDLERLAPGASTASQPLLDVEPTQGAPQEAPRLRQIGARLRAMGVAQALSRRILDLVANAPASEGDPIDPRKSPFTLSAIAGMLPGIGPAGEKTARCFAFVGPGGAGKTTTIAKLAEQRAAKGDKNFAVLSLDADRPGGADLLAKQADRLGIAFAAVRGSLDIQRALEVVGAPRLVLIDTAGIGPRESAALDALRERLGDDAKLAVHLVLPANLEEQAMQMAARTFQSMRPATLVFTKVDETARLGSLLNVPVALELPVAALGHGRSLDGHLAPGTRRLIAELVLGLRPPTLAGGRG
jgi:flagellar biosynthesis protein FlhF